MKHLFVGSQQTHLNLQFGYVTLCLKFEKRKKMNGICPKLLYDLETHDCIFWEDEDFPVFTLKD